MLSVVIFHITRPGDYPDFYVIGGDEVRVFVVDEGAPDDRVYELLQRHDASIIRELIPDGTVIGNMNDERHAAIENRITADLDGRPRFSLISGSSP